MNQLANLEPKALWRQFFNITQLPHPSGCLDALRNYIVETAQSKGFETQFDEAGNILVRTGEAPKLCLQAHYDMVPQKNDDVVFDFTKDPLSLRIVDGRVMATGTTLGRFRRICRTEVTDTDGAVVHGKRGDRDARRTPAEGRLAPFSSAH